MSATIIATSKEDYINQLKTRLATDEVVAQYGLLAIYKNQTWDEQKSESVNRHNNVGFTGTDAKFLTSLAKQLKYRGSLSPNQNKYLMKHMPKYARQILNDCLANGSVVKVGSQYINARAAMKMSLKFD